jgi:hypothetical protein
MASVLVLWDEDEERWVLLDSFDQSELAWLGQRGEFQESANPWKPENPCLLQTLGEDEVLELELKT